MSTATAASVSLRASIADHRDDVAEVLRRYQATNPRLIGSVARGDANPHSDIDLLVTLAADGGNALLRVAAIAEELSAMLGTRVDVVSSTLLRDEVAATALSDAVDL